jgi:predicted nucleic acid-binding protein
MDLADASIVAAAEALIISAIFTIDSHFHAFRLHDGSALSVLP